MRLRRPHVQAPAALTVVGLLLLSAAAFVLGLLASLILAFGLGLAALGVSCLVLSMLTEPEAVEPT